MWRFGLACGVWLLFSSIAWGQKPSEDLTFSPEAGALLKESARLFREGVELARQKQYREALAKFLASYRLIPAQDTRQIKIRAELATFIGRSYHLLSDIFKARDFYRLSLQLDTQGRQTPRAEAWLKEIIPQLRATLLLTTQPPQAECTLTHPGGEWKGVTPAKIEVEAGRLKITCALAEYHPASQIADIRIQAEKTVALTLKPLPVILPVRPPPPRPTLPPPPDRRWIGIAIASVGLAALAGGGILGGVALSQRSQADDLAAQATTPTDSLAALQTFQQAQTFATTSTILYLSGGVLAATGLVLILILKPSLPNPPATSSLLTPKTSDGWSDARSF